MFKPNSFQPSKQTLQKTVAKPKIVGTLLVDVVKKNNCVSCGARVASCPPLILSIKDDTPTMTGKCTIYEYCYYQYHRTEPTPAEIEEKLLGRVRGKGEDLGIYLDSQIG